MSENLVYLFTAALAKTRPCFQRLSGLNVSHSTSTNIVPAAVWLDRVLGYAERKSNFAVTVTPATEPGNFLFLAGRH